MFKLSNIDSLDIKLSENLFEMILKRCLIFEAEGHSTLNVI